MSGLTGIWAELELEPTRDIRSIKKAYARQTARYHPEEYPEKARLIREAFETALQLAKEESRTVRTDFVPEEDTQQDGSVPAGEDSSTLQQEDPAWSEAEKVNALAEKYAKEETKLQIRNMLYEQFTTDIALEKLDVFINRKKMQSHKAWISYLQDPIFLEALNISGFLVRFGNRIAAQKFWPKTIGLVEAVLDKEVPGGLNHQPKLQQTLAGSRQKSRKELNKVRGRCAAAGFLICLLAFFYYRGIQYDREQERREEFRSHENIEAYIEGKYGINCEVTDSVSMGLYGDMLTLQEKKFRYYLAETAGEKGVPESFHLSWADSSLEYSDISDDLEYETVRMYADDYGLTMDNMQPYSNIIQISSTPLAEFEEAFLNFLYAVQESKIVQEGHSVEIRVQPSLMFSAQVSVTVESGTEIDAEEVRAKVEECVKKSPFSYGQ